MQFTYVAGDRPLEGYTIKRGIDHGGFGEVYFAQSDGGKEVALKLVRRHLEIEQRGVGQCLNLKHPNLVTIFDVRHTATGDYWIVMEFIHGKPLAEVIAEHPTGLPPDEARRLFELLCDAGGYLHDKGIVHRDLKPQNMFIEDGSLKVGDYGLSKFITPSRRGGQTESIGTVHYMAPELARGSYGKEIDIYAAGVILYEMLTGRKPFDGESVTEVLMKHLVTEPDLHALPPAYRPVLARALAKDPLHRYPSFQAMREDLAAHLAGKPLPAGGFAATLPYATTVQSPSSDRESSSLDVEQLQGDVANKKTATDGSTSSRGFAAARHSYAVRLAAAVLLLGALISTVVALALDPPSSRTTWPIGGPFLLFVLLGLLFSLMIGGILYLVLTARGESMADRPTTHSSQDLPPP